MKFHIPARYVYLLELGYGITGTTTACNATYKGKVIAGVRGSDQRVWEDCERHQKANKNK